MVLSGFKIILEHFAFVPPMLNVNSYKVQNTVFYSYLMLFFTVISGMFEYLSEHILGLTIGFTLTLFGVMIGDFITGTLVSLKEGKEEGLKKREILKSKRGLAWIVKFGVYLMLINTVNSLYQESLTIQVPIVPEIVLLIKLYLLIHILLWETKSIDENLERLGFSFRILKVFHEIGKNGIDNLKNKINDKINKDENNK